MKALYCRRCRDLFNLTTHIKACHCGQTFGVYLPKQRTKTEYTHHAWYVGEDAVPIALDNITFSRAIKRNDKSTIGRFTSFIFEEQSPTFVKRKDE